MLLAPRGVLGFLIAYPTSPRVYLLVVGITSLSETMCFCTFSRRGYLSDCIVLTRKPCKAASQPCYMRIPCSTIYIVYSLMKRFWVIVNNLGAANNGCDWIAPWVLCPRLRLLSFELARFLTWLAFLPFTTLLQRDTSTQIICERFLGLDIRRKGVIAGITQLVYTIGRLKKTKGLTAQVIRTDDSDLHVQESLSLRFFLSWFRTVLNIL